MAGYTRQSSYTDGDVINAADSNNEFDQVLAAFNNSSGHKHDGTASEGPVIGLIGDAGSTTPKNKVVVDDTNNQVEINIDVSGTSTEQLVIKDGVIEPTTDDDIDLGSSGKEFKDLYIDGTAYLDAINYAGTAITSTAAELNLMDGGTSAGTTAVAGGDGLVTNDAGTMRQTTVDTFDTYLAGTTKTLTNKTIDVDNNTVSNIEVDNLKSGVLDTDLSSVAGTDTTLASAKAIKTYVDAQVTAQDLDFQGDSGGALNIDLDSETLDIAGGTGIDTSGSGNTLTVAIDSTVATLTGSQTLTNKSITAPILTGSASSAGSILFKEDTDNGTNAVTLIGPASTADVTVTLPAATDTLVGKDTTDTLTNKTLTSAVLNSTISGTSIKDEDDMSSDSASHLATQQSIKAYVDATVTASDLDFQGDSGGALSIDLDSETLDIAGGTGIDTSGSSNTLTVAIDSTVATLSGSQTLTNKSIDASQLTGTVANARLDAQLQDVAGLAVTNGNFIVGDGSNFVAESGATARSSLGLGTAAVTDTGIGNGNVAVFTSGAADDDFLRINGTAIEGRSAAEVLSDIGGQASLTFGISNTNAVKVDSTSVADDEYARFTASGLESRSTAEVLSDIGGQASLTFGISNTNAVKIDSASVADDEYARFTANGLESRSNSEVISDIGAVTAADAANEATALAIALG
jgi:hypothetical protein